MGKRLLPLLVTLITLSQSYATHIVGGEFELKYVEESTYSLKLIIYFDDINGNPDILQQEAVISPYIFRKSDGFLMQITNIPKISQDDFVPYTNVACALESLSTRRIVYEGLIELDPLLYDDPEGYLIVWERCCRNHTINNIVNPNETGNKFLLEIPPVVKNGAPFINSSPSLFPPLSDYACINQLYYVDFAGTDDDGDSLVYSLVTPLDSSTPEPVPEPTPQTFREAVWANGFDLANVIPGSPSLAINNKGFITVNPFFTGIYVFSVLVEEYRDQEKIGELRRDFQMLVVDGCNPPDPPVASVEKFDGTPYVEGDTLKFTIVDGKCFDFLITDEQGENVTLRAVGVNFDQDVEGIFSIESGFLSDAEDTLRVEVCMPDCPYVFGEPFIIDMLAADDACPQPQIDTVRMLIEVEPPENGPPTFDIMEELKNLNIDEGEFYAEEITMRDPDGDSILSVVQASGFMPEEWGMSFTVIQNDPGLQKILFEWDTDCIMYDFVAMDQFDFYLAIDDDDDCNEPLGDTLSYHLNVNLPLNTVPQVRTEFGITEANVLIKSSFSVDVLASDEDNDEISLIAVGDGFELDDVGAQFTPTSGIGTTQSTFSWDLSCANLGINDNESFRIFFISEDEDLCREINFDTLTFDVNVLVPFNIKPEFDSYSDYELPIDIPFELEIVATDQDNDFLQLELLDGFPRPPSSNFVFEPQSGDGEVVSLLSWTPECSLLEDGILPNDYTVYFFVFDDNCPNQKGDTLAINFNIIERVVDYGAFRPPNVFTPNGDSHNDTYKLHDLEDLTQNLPPDNCANSFISITILDRYGKTVFFSDDRAFEWFATGLPASTYFYHIKYLNTDYRGTITILY